jgi:hypothetical protein
VIFHEMTVIGACSPELTKLMRFVGHNFHRIINKVHRKPGYCDSRSTCGRASLILRDFLRQADIFAVEASVYCEVVGRDRDGRGRQINIGDPNSLEPSVDQWNGHVIVLAQGHLIDTTLYQVQRCVRHVGSMMAMPLLQNPLYNADGRQIIARRTHKNSTIQWTLFGDNPDWPGVRDGTSGDEIFEAVAALVAAYEAKPSKQGARCDRHRPHARVHSPGNLSQAPSDNRSLAKVA